MKGLQDAMPAFNTRYVIVAPDNDREKVVEEANRQQFLSLDARYFPIHLLKNCTTFAHTEICTE